MVIRENLVKLSHHLVDGSTWQPILKLNVGWYPIMEKDYWMEITWTILTEEM